MYVCMYVCMYVIDRYSRFPEVEVVRSTKASSVVPKLDRIFAVHGIPRVIKTDNEPLFNGEKYKRYGEALGIYHLSSPPRYGLKGMRSRTLHTTVS